MAFGYDHVQTSLMVKTETTWGTPVVPDTKVGTIKTFTPKRSWEVYEVQGAGDGREVQNYVKTRFNCGASLTAEMHDLAFLQYGVGVLAGSGTSGSPYTITEADFTGVTAGTNILPFSMACSSEGGATDDVDTYTGCRISKFTISGEIGKPLMGNFDIVAKTLTSSTSSLSYTPYTTTPLMISAGGTFKWGATPTAVSLIRNVSITYDNNYRIFGDFNSIYIVDPQSGKRKITFSVTVVMTSTIATTLRDDFYGASNTPSLQTTGEFTADKEIEVAIDEGASSTNRRNYLWLDQCIIDDIQKPISVDDTDMVLMTFTGRAKTGGKTGSSNVFATWWTV